MLQSSGFSTHHKQKMPKRSLDSEKKGIQCSRKLYIMHVKIYVKKDFAQVPRQQFYYKFKGKDVENKFKYIQIEKFAAKYLI